MVSSNAYTMVRFYWTIIDIYASYDEHHLVYECDICSKVKERGLDKFTRIVKVTTFALVVKKTQATVGQSL